MDESDIRALAEAYRDALELELSTKQTASHAEQRANQIKDAIISSAYQDGAVDGKNAETRKAQENAALAESQKYQDSLRIQTNSTEAAAICETQRKALDAEIGLVKAWLYSQAHIG